jgi:hypothetical protein
MARVFRYEPLTLSATNAPSSAATNAPPAKAHGHSAPMAKASGEAARPASPAHPHTAGLGEHAHDMAYLWGAAAVMSHMSEGTVTWMNPKNDLLASWEVGWQRVDEPQYEVDAVYQRYVNQNFQAFAGMRFTNQDGTGHRGIFGVNYRLPLMIWANASVDTRGDVRITMSKRFQVTSRLGVWADAFYDTGTEWEWTVGADYTLTRRLSLSASYHSDFGAGAGLLFRF